MNEFLQNNWQGLLTIVGGIVVWLNKRPLARWALRKEQADYNSTTIGNLERGLKMYAAMLDDIERRHGAALAKRDEEIAKLHEELEELKEELHKHILKENGHEKSTD